MTINIQFVNGSTTQIMRQSFAEEHRYCRNHISYSGNKVQRVEIICNENSRFAVWDRDWDDISKVAGLEFPK